MVHYQTLLFLIVLVLAVSAADQAYITKYDNVDLDEIFNSKRLLDNYMNCLKDVGPCTPDGRELKDNLPDALMSDCAKCSEKQRIGSDKVIRFIIANRPEDFTILERLYDPTGEYRRKYMQSDALIERVKQEAGELSSSGDGTVETEGHATEHNSSEDHGEGRMDASENLKQKSE